MAAALDAERQTKALLEEARAAAVQAGAAVDRVMHATSRSRLSQPDQLSRRRDACGDKCIHAGAKYVMCWLCGMHEELLTPVEQHTACI
jgi:hypothetical protein